MFLPRKSQGNLSARAWPGWLPGRRWRVLSAAVQRLASPRLALVPSPLLGAEGAGALSYFLTLPPLKTVKRLFLENVPLPVTVARSREQPSVTGSPGFSS